VRGGIEKLDYTFVAPKSEEELLKEINAEGAYLMSGGTDLLVKIRIGKVKPKKIVSLSKIPTLKFIKENDEELIVGATTTHTELLEYEPLREKFPILFDAVYTIGSPQIRNRGTLAGNVINASPAGDSLLALYLLEAKVEISNGKIVNLEDFIIGPSKTILQRGEYVRAIHIPKSKWDIHYFEKVGQRNAMTISVVSVGWLIRCDGDSIEEMRMAFGSVAPTVIRLRDVEEFARGKKINKEFVDEISKMVKNDVKPIDDVRASADYRRKLSSNIVYRMIEEGIKC
jgi:xanthine dehydrogenase FAD-binding subunit